MTSSLNSAIDLLNGLGDLHWQFAKAMFIQVSLLIGILLCADLLLLRRMRAAVRYGLWTLVLVKLVLPVSLHSPVSIVQWLPNVPAEVPQQLNVAHSTEPEVVSSPSVSIQLQADPVLTREDVVAVSTATSAQHSANNPIVYAAPSPALATLQWRTWVLFAWTAITMTFFVLVIRHSSGVRGVVARSHAPSEALTSLLVGALEQTNTAADRIRLRTTDELKSPAICGFLRGTILVPRSLETHLDHRQIHLVLVHELTHWRRLDLQVNLLQTFLQAIYFYNPLLWLANHRIRQSREQAVDEAVLASVKASPEQYSSTLLRIAESSNGGLGMALRLVGVLESRAALSTRLRRIMSRPLPNSARLGLTGFMVVALVGLVLLPMDERNKTTANSFDGQDQEPAGEVRDQAVEERAVLVGEVRDETGAPVSDAVIELIGAPGKGRRDHLKTAANDEGYYEFRELRQAGEYWLQVKSKRCVGIEFRDKQVVHLTPGMEVELNLTLRRACRLRVRVVDEESEPIRGVTILANSLTAESHIAPAGVPTNSDGWAIVPIPPSDEPYLIATMHSEYAFESRRVVLNDPDKAAVQKIMLRKGETIAGTAVCSDGKPPAGWRILAMPSWWHFGVSPNGSVIGPDGSFTLPHIASGKYNVTISIPLGDAGHHSPKHVLRSAELLKAPRPLAVKLDHLSPESLVYISGRIRFNGEESQQGFWIFANSSNNNEHSSTFFRPGMDQFRIGPVPAGMYTLRVEQVGIESKPVAVTAPAKDVELRLTVKGRPRLKGIVARADSGERVKRFQVRVVKLRTLKGPHFVENTDWLDIEDDEGVFEIDVNSPGVFQVIATAEGFSWARSEPFNTVEQVGESIRIELNRGVSLSGVVVDEQGAPVVGALVELMSMAAIDAMPSSKRRSRGEYGAVTHQDGTFLFEHLAPGKDVLRVTHPKYCLALVEDLTISASDRAEPLRVVTQRGATVRGRVYDLEGRPEPNVTLHFQDNPAIESRGLSTSVTVVTDEEGSYEVNHLPAKLCYVRRADEWESLGVVRHAILPENGRTHTLDLGGVSQLSGRISVNGQPLSQTRLLLSGESPHFGIFKAFGETDATGSFLFRGVAPGRRTLYYQLPGRRSDWGTIREIDVTSQDIALGDIDHFTGRITVSLEAEADVDLATFEVHASEYNPIWTHGRIAGSVERRSSQDPFVIDSIPTGKYELKCSRSRHHFQPGQFLFRQLIELTSEAMEQKVVMKIPKGTASLSGHIHEKIHRPGSTLKIWSTDRTRHAVIYPKDDGSYRLDSVPAGDYVLRVKDTRDAPVISRVSLQEGETRELNITPETVAEPSAPIGFLSVRAVTAEGVPVPCNMHLEGAAGDVTPHSSQRGRTTFVAEPRRYTLVARHPGFHEVRRTVELAPVDAEGRPVGDFQVQVSLDKE